MGAVMSKREEAGKDEPKVPDPVKKPEAPAKTPESAQKPEPEKKAEPKTEADTEKRNRSAAGNGELPHANVCRANQHYHMYPKLSYMSNGRHIWTEEDPDVELIEPPLFVSIDKNLLKYGRSMHRPSVSHSIMLINHGIVPVAFQVLTSDNYSYYVSQVHGTIPGRCFNSHPYVRVPNSVSINVYRRPYTTFADDEQLNKYNTPSKDRLFIQLAPSFSFSLPPATLFHPEAAYEKLRVCLHYTGGLHDPKNDHASLRKTWPGWNTWDKRRIHRDVRPYTKEHPGRDDTQKSHTSRSRKGQFRQTTMEHSTKEFPSSPNQKKKKPPSRKAASTCATQPSAEPTKKKPASKK